MWCSKQTDGAIADEAISDRKVAEDGKQAHPTAIAIVQPRQTRYTRCRDTTNTRQSREWSVVPQDVDVNNDIMRLVSSLSNVIQILVRMSNTAAHELLRHPERGEDYEGLRLLLNYADLMYTTLLQVSFTVISR
ncbi:GH10586 [Drosophila grimshawi]|uniref:GH10586 n=1 Tax=Drosophila grimshawi TaxID=7222 RepID=B4JD98_DROGR|nr:GH10586 [Drosophila grimshawi]